MDPKDEETIYFITDRGTYCYKVMPFGLTNVGATYQRLVTKIFQEHLEKTMKVYIDDMVVKSARAEYHHKHLEETFAILEKYNMKLNTKKYLFGVASGVLVFFNMGIEVNPTQIKEIEELPDVLSSKKEVQKLTGRITALGRFISKSSKRCFKFFSLTNQNKFEWTDEYQQSLRDLKTYMSNPPLLSKLKEGERFLVYLVVFEVAVSAKLVREEKGTQSPIYYVSKALLKVETRYPYLENQH